MFSLYNVLVSLLGNRFYRYRNKGKIWSDGEHLLTKTEELANALADLIDLVDDCQTTTGYYDPEEDEKAGEVDELTGYYYVSM